MDFIIYFPSYFECTVHCVVVTELKIKRIERREWYEAGRGIDREEFADVNNPVKRPDS